MRFVSLIFVAAGLLAASVFVSPAGAETQPGDPCTVGEIHRAQLVGGPESPGNGHIIVCDGSEWKPVIEWDTATGSSLTQIDYDSGSCTAGKDGRIRYSSADDPPWEYCDGGATTWRPFKQPRCQDDGAGECYLDATRDNDDPDFVAANIADGVNILGVTGTLIAGGGTPTLQDSQVFTANGTWNKPVGIPDDGYVVVEVWGGGGGSSAYSRADGGGGGGYTRVTFFASDLPSSVAVTVGGGGAKASATLGAVGATGGTSSFGTYVYAYGGGGGAQWTGAAGQSGGGGGGCNASAGGGTPNFGIVGSHGACSSISTVYALAPPIIERGGHGGAYSGSCNTFPEPAVYAGGGGGGPDCNSGVGGTSIFGGSGGNSGSNGSIPGGGGGQNGSGARGEVRVKSYW